VTDFDIILFGATGFTGQLVAAHLASRGPVGLRWALAGRSLPRLEGVRESLQALHPGLDLPLIQADSADDESLARMVARTRVVCTTVGPYLHHGLPLVRACAEAGVACCDLTGEVPFIRQSIDRAHDIARASGARIVHCCGYDSIPSDLGTLMVQAAMVERGGPATRVRTYVGPSRGGASGGTVASGLAAMELATADRAVRRMMADPYGLDPAGTPRGPEDRDPTTPAFLADIQQWSTPFLMGSINTRVVRRSHALLGQPWGTDFSYQERMAVGGGLAGRLRATAITAGLGALMVAAGQPRLRGLLASRLPQPGDGPDEDKRESGFFRHLLVAEGPSGRLVGRVIGHKDPGYAATAIMLGQSALCLAFDQDESPDCAGVLTPATALGPALLRRLRDEGMTWSVEDWPEGAVPRP
jgi:short subunit dehydrogenase-like uncharacterized protein